MKQQERSQISYNNQVPDKFIKKGKIKVNMGSTSTCNLISMQNSNKTIDFQIDMENTSFLGKTFPWNKTHTGVKNHVKTVYSNMKEENEEKYDTDKSDF